MTVLVWGLGIGWQDEVSVLVGGQVDEDGERRTEGPLQQLGENAMAALWEPSLGPVFGVKGVSTGYTLSCI